MHRHRILSDWFQRVWIDGDLDAVDGFFADNTSADGMLTGIACSAADFQALVPAIMQWIRDPVVTLDRLVESGAWVCALVHISAVAAETMRPVTITGQIMLRLDEHGKIVEAYNHFDHLAFFEQLGFLPQDTMALCLGGVELVVGP